MSQLVLHFTCFLPSWPITAQGDTHAPSHLNKQMAWCHWMVSTSGPRTLTGIQEGQRQGDLWSMLLGQAPWEPLNLKLNYFSQIQFMAPLSFPLLIRSFIHPAIFTEYRLCASHCFRDFLDQDKGPCLHRADI